MNENEWMNECHVLKDESLATPWKPQFCNGDNLYAVLKMANFWMRNNNGTITHTKHRFQVRLYGWGWSLILWNSRGISNEPRQTPHSCNSTTNQFRCSAVMGLVLEENLAIQHLEKEELTDQMMNWHLYPRPLILRVFAAESIIEYKTPPNMSSSFKTLN